MILPGCGQNRDEGKSPEEQAQADTIPADLRALNDLIKKDPQNAASLHERAKYFLANDDLNAALGDVNDTKLGFRENQQC